MGKFSSLYRFILLPSFVGLVCFACVSSPGAEQNGDIASLSNSSADPPETDSDTGQMSSVAQATDNNAESAVSLSETSDSAYQEGINLASSANYLSQSAVSPDDWSLIANRWQRAAEQLQKVSAKSERYAIAQQKIPEYVRNADFANAKLKALQQSVNTPLPTHIATAVRPRVVDPNISAANTTSSINPSNNQATSANRTRTAITAVPPSNSRNNNHAGGIQVPIVRRLHGTPVVRVTFNDQQSYEMILDTGASRTLITRRMASDLGVIPTERMLAATAGANNVSFDLGQMRSISMGTVTLQNAKVGIGDAINIGLLGNDFLRGYDVTIREASVELVVAE
ncbi:MAG: Aspartyl protease [Phormidesmis priestleyi Ana]|uniref:Aspartyl protease n=1 Tax=Phormidesmis priestleyi Ana TaxID=1666911 RepID=A0A0P7ZV52_9CYAN|nr:MAG: Aspartyl protease [Phormidesmis priestleyi Ana]